MDDTVRTPLDEPVSNGDLLITEVEVAPSDGQDAGVDEPGADGLESVELRLPAAPEAAAAVAEAVPSLAGLADVALASNALGLAETVLFPDERIRISPASAFPWRVHCALRITAKDGSAWIGTAFFISPRVLATAGHCVFINSPSEARKGWVRRIDVMPGR
ncbi:MAG TPA: hypothetical protein VK891_11110, partial [Euzebyales bacterium]|nr:hypothetical protein [Euzebyales bacterium]